MNAALIRGALAIMTGCAGERARATGPDLRIDANGRIEAIGALEPRPGETVLDARGCVLYPGWVNTHHHLAQSVLKGVPAGLNEPLAQWMTAVPYRYRSRYDESLFALAVEIGIAELVLSGCTTLADHQFIHWPQMSFDPAEIVFTIAARLGVRLVYCRGGGTVAPQYAARDVAAPTPDSLASYVEDVARLVRRYHDPGEEALCRVVMAPTTVTWSVTPADLRALAHAARALGIRMHSHLSETSDTVRYCAERFGQRPAEFLAEHEWLGADVWLAHMVHLDAAELALVARSGTAMAHCPASNCRLGSGIAPAPEFARLGGVVSLGVDGSASNEAGDAISEAHTCWYTHRATKGAAAISVEDVVHWGTRGGALALGIDNIGTLEPGRAADVAVYALDQLRYAGLHDPAIGPVASGGKPKLRYLLVQGRVVVENDSIPGADIERLLARAGEAVRRLAA